MKNLKNLAVAVAVAVTIALTGITVSNANEVRDTTKEFVRGSKEVVAFILRPTEKVIEGVKWLYSDTSIKEKDDAVELVDDDILVPQIGSTEYLIQLEQIKAQLNEITQKSNLSQKDITYLKTIMFKLDAMGNRTTDIMSKLSSR